MPAIVLLVRAAAAVMVVGAVAVPTAAAAGGRTSQGEPMSAKAGKRVVGLTLGWRADCHDGGKAPRGTAVVKRLALRRGRFSISEEGRQRGSDGVTVRYKATLRGRVRRRAVSGSLRLVISGPYDDGSAFHCDTGPVTFPARKRAKGKGKATLAITARGKLIELKLKQPGRRRRPGPPPAPGPHPGASSPTTSSSTSGPGDAGPGPGAEPPPNAPGVHGNVIYRRYACNGTSPQFHPLGGAWIEVRRDNGSSSAALTRADASGRFTVPSLPGTGAFRVTLIFETPRIRVVPAGQVLFPYRTDLGLLEFDGLTFVVAPGGPTDVANILDRLDTAADFAAKISPSPPPQVAAFARWDSDLTGWLGDDPQSRAQPGAPWIFVGATRTGSVRDALEPYVLAHEYGHQVHQSLTGFPPGTGGPHDGFKAFPDQPGLPFSEGFADFFAAALLGTGALRGPDGEGGCRTTFDVGTTPASYWPADGTAAVPLPLDNEKQWAQYQEMNIAAAYHHAAEALGGGDPDAGAAEVLRSIKAFKTVFGRTPTTPRDVRDALLEFAAAPEAVEQKVGNAFADQRISYGVTARTDLSVYDYAFVISFNTRIVGPGGVACEGEYAVTHPDPYFLPGSAWLAFSGPLAPGRHDDCFLGGGEDADAFYDGAFWDLPFFAGNAHHGKEWSVQVAIGPGCPSGSPAHPFDCHAFSTTIPVRVGTGRWHRPGEDPFASTPLNEKTATVTVTSADLPQAPEDPLNWKTVATFDADGVCTVKIGPTAGAECGVGRGR